MKQLQTPIPERAFARSITSLFAALICGTAMAESDELAFTMITITDSAHGAELAAGRYEVASTRIAAMDKDDDAFFNSTNLCVAYTKMGSTDEATLACDAAIEHASQIRVARGSRSSRTSEVRLRREYRALALSNRGVLRAVKGDVTLAREDFLGALVVRKRAAVARNNLERLEELDIESS